MAYALPRYVLRPGERDPSSERQLREKFRGAVLIKCGRTDTNLMARDSGCNARTRMFRAPPDGAFGGSSRGRDLWRFPPKAVTGPMLGRIAAGRSSSWNGTAFCLATCITARCLPKFRHRFGVLRFLNGAKLFAIKRHGQLIRVPPDPQVHWLVDKLDICALQFWGC